MPFVYHVSKGRNHYGALGKSVFTSSSNAWGTADPTASDFGINEGLLTSTANYIAYIFAHDPTGIIQCGTYTGNGSSTGAAVTLGFTPQFLFIKSDGLESPYWFDSARGLGSSTPYLTTDGSPIETGAGTDFIDTSGTGFTPKLSSGSGPNVNTTSYYYMAIKA